MRMPVFILMITLLSAAIAGPTIRGHQQLIADINAAAKTIRRHVGIIVIQHRCGRLDAGGGKIAHRPQLWRRVCGTLPGDGFRKTFNQIVALKSQRAKLAKVRRCTKLSLRDRPSRSSKCCTNSRGVEGVDSTDGSKFPS